MKVKGKNYQTIWFEKGAVKMIDQNKLPFSFEIISCSTWEETAEAIKYMTVRGAGAIGAAAGFAMAQAFLQAPDPGRDIYLQDAIAAIEATRPTARDLFYATRKVFASTSARDAVNQALQIAADNANEGKRIGEIGSQLISDGMGILTHCNAGWLAFVDHGSALSPLYEARRKGRNFTVFVDETRPRCQGSKLTAWELGNEKIPHHIITDNAAGFFMQQGKIQMAITGADRVAANGDVVNKIGTLEKAVLAKAFNIPFYVAVPLSTFDPDAKTGNDIQIEYRTPDEVLKLSGYSEKGIIEEVSIAAPGSDALNPAFDMTPAAYITGLITSKGIIKASQGTISALFSNKD